MRTFKCPICGSSNEENAKTCESAWLTSVNAEDLQLQIQHELENQQEAVPLQEDEKITGKMKCRTGFERIRPQSDEKKINP